MHAKLNTSDISNKTSILFSIKLEVPVIVPGIYSISVTVKAIILKAR